MVPPASELRFAPARRFSASASPALACVVLVLLETEKRWVRLVFRSCTGVLNTGFCCTVSLHKQSFPSPVSRVRLDVARTLCDARLSGRRPGVADAAAAARGRRRRRRGAAAAAALPALLGIERDGRTERRLRQRRRGRRGRRRVRAAAQSLLRLRFIQ